MEAATAPTLRFPAWTGQETIGRKSNGYLRFHHKCVEEKRIRMLNRRNLPRNTASALPRVVAVKVSASHNNSPASTLQLGNVCTSSDEALILEKKAQAVGPHLNGRCIYLVGMMGSGKTTVGKMLSEVIGYSFVDSDKLVEEAVGIPSVAEIFKQRGEAFFRDNESEVLRELSFESQLVVATGGGAVIRPINWKYMKQGITVWLDVPLKALARRIAAVGTDSRPLLHGETDDAYSEALSRLETLFEDRGEAYSNADCRVSLLHMADNLGLNDVSVLTPTAIAIEALVQIKHSIERDGDTIIAEKS